MFVTRMRCADVFGCGRNVRTRMGRCRMRGSVRRSVGGCSRCLWGRIRVRMIFEMVVLVVYCRCVGILCIYPLAECVELLSHSGGFPFVHTNSSIALPLPWRATFFHFYIWFWQPLNRSTKPLHIVKYKIISISQCNTLEDVGL